MIGVGLELRRVKDPNPIPYSKEEPDLPLGRHNG